MSATLKLLVSAGEVSGDQHAAALLEALDRRVGGLSALGLGGDRCAARGMRLLAHQRDLAVVGLVEAIGKIRLARKLIREKLMCQKLVAVKNAARRPMRREKSSRPRKYIPRTVRMPKSAEGNRSIHGS